MKSRFLAILATGALAIAFAGCHDKYKDEQGAGPSRESIVAALDKLGLEKAPTLGPVFKDFTLAVFDQKYDVAWNLITTASQKAMTQELADELGKLRDDVNRLDSQIDQPGISDADKDFYGIQRSYKKSRIDTLTRLNADGAKYFALTMKDFGTGKGFEDIVEAGKAEDIAAGKKAKVKITGETINGAAGYITEQYDTGQEKQIPFAREDGKWKMDYAKMLPQETPAPDAGTTHN